MNAKIGILGNTNQVNRYQFEPGGTWVESIGLKQRAATTRAMTEPDGLLAVHKAEKKGVL